MDETATGSSGNAQAGPSTSQSRPKDKKPSVVILCIGMAGSVSWNLHRRFCSLLNMLHQGKTTLMQRLNSYLHTKGSPPYILNLDPAVTHMPYSANIDIRDTVDYKEVMKQSAHSILLYSDQADNVKVQSRSEWRHPDRTESLHDQVRPGPRIRREESGKCRVSASSFRPHSS